MYIRKRLLTGLGALAVTISMLPMQPMISKQTPWDGHIAAGRDALHNGDYTEARRQLDEALNDTRTFQAKDPRLGETYFCLGELNYSEQNFGEAKHYYQRALELQQQTPGTDDLKIADTLYGLANAAEMSGDRDLATILLKRVKEIWIKQYGAGSPKLLKVLKPMGIYATVSGDFPTAEQCYRQLVSLEESNSGANSIQTASALNLLSLTLSRTGKYAESEPFAQRAVAVLASSPDYRSMYEQALDNLSYIDHQLGKPEPNVDLGGDVPPASAAPTTRSTASLPTTRTPAVPAAKPAVATAPPTKVTSVTPQTMAPVLEASSNKFEYKTQPRTSSATAPMPATKPATSSVQTTTTTTEVVLRPPSTQAMRTDTSEFRPWELPGQHKDGGEKQAHINWGTISYLAGGRLITPEEYQAMLLANEAYELIRQEKYKMAADILYKALGICPELASVHTNLGLVLSQVGNRQEAIDQLKEAISIDPKKSAPWINLASAFQIDGQLKASVATYGEFVRRFPNHPLTPKAHEIASHLRKELNEQTAVEAALGSKAGTFNDYFAYASHSGEMRWPSSQSTIRVYLERGDGIIGFRPEYDGFCQQSFKEWASASGGKVAFEFVKRPESADVDWRWTNDFSKVSSVAEGGETNVQSAGKQIKHASVTVLTVNPSVDTPLSTNQVRAVCLHEIGHALGIIGHSPKPDDIMYCSMPGATAKPSLSTRDVGTIQKLYQLDVASIWNKLSGYLHRS